MTNREQASVVPKLRFPEFRGVDAWEPTKIGALGRFYYGKSAPKWSLAKDAPTPCVRYGELYTKFGAVITETYSRTNADPKTLRFSKGGEILIPRVGEKPEDFGKCCAYLPLKDIAIGEMISVLETKQHPLFYTYYFRNLYKQFAKVVEGQNVKNLYFSELEPLPIYRPSIPEQQKVAGCLSSLDELIAAQARKVDALKTHKKGLMQQLFPRQGETQPRLRFPKFQHTGAWQKQKVSSLLTKSVKPVSIDSDTTYREIGIRSHGKGIFHKETIRGKAIGDKRVFWVVQEALVLNIVFAWEQAVAVTSPAEEGMIASHRFPMYSARPNKANVHCIKYFFLSEKGKDLLGIASPGGAGRNKTLGQKDFENLEFLLPSTVNEQKEIADILFAHDALISVQSKKLESLKTHKKGLMQQLFPSAEAVEA